jgi:hypothetical protein
LCPKKDLQKLETVIKRLGYSGERYNDLYKLKREDGSKIDLALVTEEDKDAVTYGRIAVTRFPRDLFYTPQKGHIDGFEFSIAPNELLKTWGKDAPNEIDSEYVKTLPADSELMKLVQRVRRP